MKFTVVFAGVFGEYTRDLYAEDLEDLGWQIEEVINCDIVDDEIYGWEIIEDGEEYIGDTEDWY